MLYVLKWHIVEEFYSTMENSTLPASVFFLDYNYLLLVASAMLSWLATADQISADTCVVRPHYYIACPLSLNIAIIFLWMAIRYLIIHVTNLTVSE